MPTNTTDQQITIPIGTDGADNPQAFIDQMADVETRLVLKYTTVADRAARHTAPIENDLTGLSTENRYDTYNGAAYVSLEARSYHGWGLRGVDGTAGTGLVNNVTVLVNDPLQAVALDAGATYKFQAVQFYDSSAVADIKFAFTVPAFTAFRWGGIGAGVAGTTDIQVGTATTSGGVLAFGGNGVGTTVTAILEGFITTSAAGNLQLQFAQNAADPTNTVLRNGSYVRAWRMS